MQPTIGSKLKDKHATQWLAALTGRLYPGEVVTAIARAGVVRPLIDGVAVTNARVVAFYSSTVGTEGPRREVAADDITAVEVAKRFTARSLVVTTRSGETVVLGAIPDPDLDMVLGAVRQLAQLGPAADVQRAMADRAGLDRRTADAWRAVQTIGGTPNDPTWKSLRDHCSPGEVPWFVVCGVSGAGVLAAFDDRCMIVKIGLMTGFMAGSVGGGRVTTFPYGEITGIEYNSGLLTGVLEVLTASFSGIANKDYWRGTTKSRNADANDPWTLSNTLPLARPQYQQALPRLNEMRARIAEGKRPAPAAAPIPAPAAAAPGLADELGKLAGLRDQGVLTEAEFAAAKQRLLARHRVD